MIIKTLSIAGFDGSGGAGLQADLKTFSALGCYGMTVLTALPIQNTMGVSNCYTIPITAIEEQLKSIFEDIIPDAIKIGMVFNHEIVSLIAEFISIHAKNIPIIIDPVMVAKSGDLLLLPDAVELLKNKLFRLAAIVTPNLDEASVICGREIINQKDMFDAGKLFLNLGAQSVLVKGGHLNDDICSDLLLTHDSHHWLSYPRIKTKNTHGTGCTLSAAITANLAHGLNIYESCTQAKDYISNAIKSFQNESIGNGNGPVNHFYNIWNKV